MSPDGERRSISKCEGDMRNDLPDDVASDALSTAELRSVIAALKPSDEQKLMRAAEFLCYVNGFDDPRGLLQEAMVRALSGTRRCPRDTEIVPFLFGAMRSIANSVSKSAKRSPIDQYAELDSAEEQDKDEGIEATQNITPEREAIARDMLQKVNDLFKDDADAQLVLYAMADGVQGQELREVLGLTDTQHNTIRRRMMRQSKALADSWRLR
jgi:DNA-directed RNA polymerase specialized sigma24 family protein